MSNPSHKERSISFLFKEDEIAATDRAAALRGISRVDFVRDAALSAAEAAVLQSDQNRISEEGFAEFLEVLSAPAVLVPEMVEALRRRPPWDDARSESASRFENHAAKLRAKTDGRTHTPSETLLRESRDER